MFCIYMATTRNERGLLHSAPVHSNFFAGAKKELNGMFETNEEVKYWISKVNCRGEEESLLACLHSGIGTHTCGRNGRAKVICKGKDIIMQVEIACQAHIR